MAEPYGPFVAKPLAKPVSAVDTEAPTSPRAEPPPPIPPELEQLIYQLKALFADQTMALRETVRADINTAVVWLDQQHKHDLSELDRFWDERVTRIEGKLDAVAKDAFNGKQAAESAFGVSEKALRTAEQSMNLIKTVNDRFSKDASDREADEVAAARLVGR